MKAYIKRIYLLWFQTKYFIFSLFIKQEYNTILFIQEFNHTLDLIQNRYSSSIYNKVNIYPKEKTNTKIKKILKAKTIYIDNYNILLGYVPKKKKTIFQVWHGAMAVKNIGFADEHLKNVSETNRKRYQRVYDSVDYYICASEHIKETFMTSFNQKESKMLMLGYPKLDYYLDSNYKDKIQTIQIQNEYLLNRMNILYIPTFRDNDIDNEKQIKFINQLYNDFQEEYNILYKIHPKVKKIQPQINGKEVLSEELECMIGIADIIITDYSSIIVEGLLQEKALIYYLYDLENYNANRGLNLNITTLPGVHTYTYKEVKDTIQNRKYTNNNIEQLPTKYIPINLINKREMITAKVIKETLKIQGQM